MKILIILLLAWLVLSVIAGLYNRSGLNRDDSDAPNGPRSNLRVLTDHKTGLQYLGGARGGLTPRLDIHGNHMRAQ